MIWNDWRQKRRADARARVTDCLNATSGMTGYQLMKCTGMGAARLYVALAELEQEDKLNVRWQDGQYPLRRLYQLAGRES